MKTFLLGAAIAAVATPALTQTAAPGPAVTRAQVSQKVQKVFARIDANKDGFISQAEAQAMTGHRGQVGGAGIFERIDSNRDGQITRAEAAAARAAIAARIDSRGAHANAMFDRADANRDGAVSRAEFDAMHGQQAQRAGRKSGLLAGLGRRMFVIADADKDGRVSVQEATALSMSHFDSADANRDGTVTSEERQLRRQQRRAAASRG